jgi:hypothetical protein
MGFLFNKNKRKYSHKIINIGKKDIIRARSLLERRSGEDRRAAYDLNYFNQDGSERRKNKERRVNTEKRKGWLRISKWGSIFVGNKNKKKKP